MEKSVVKNKVIEIIKKTAGHNHMNTELDEEINLLQMGFLDSMTFIDVVLTIGKTFHIEIADEDIMNSDSATIKGLCDMVLKKQSVLKNPL